MLVQAYNRKRCTYSIQDNKKKKKFKTMDEKEEDLQVVDLCGAGS